MRQSTSVEHAEGPREETKLCKSELASLGQYNDDTMSEVNFPLIAFFWPARWLPHWIVILIVIQVTFLYKWCTGLWGYSGFQKPPMFGDFEAHRHWMELTQNLPIFQWYFYDLGYWGLDYPPLTAYHSWLCGKIGSKIDPAWFALNSSRGHETQDLKVFMRASVAVTETIIYLPAAIFAFKQLTALHRIDDWKKPMALFTFLLQPAMILIDFGHFQYNNAMLGLTLGSLGCLLGNKYLLACVLFVAALEFKQMALFYAPAVFAYLLSICLQPRLSVGRFSRIATTTVLSLVLPFMPVLISAYRSGGVTIKTLPAPSLLQSLPLRPDVTSPFYPLLLETTQIIHRVFPLARGVFEDKVANLWCAVHVVYKLHNFSPIVLQRAALLATCIAVLPPCTILFLRPRRQLLPWALATTAWGFFLVAYQVHEKSILLPLMPMTLLIATEAGFESRMRAWIGLANTLATWSLFPLLKRDGLQIPYAVLSLTWAWLLGLPPTSIRLYSSSESHPNSLTRPEKAVHLALYFAMGLWHFAEFVIPPPSGKPDLWIVANVVVGASGFVLCYLWCLLNLLERSGLAQAWPMWRREELDRNSKTK